MANKEGTTSVRMDTEVYKKMVKHCLKIGVKMSFFITEAVKEKMAAAKPASPYPIKQL